MTFHATRPTSRAAPPDVDHIIVPFFADEAGALHPDAPRRSRSRRGAIAVADDLASFYEGVLVLRDARGGNGAAGVTRDLVCVIGDVPGEVVRRLAA